MAHRDRLAEKYATANLPPDVEVGNRHRDEKPCISCDRLTQGRLVYDGEELPLCETPGCASSLKEKSGVV